MTQPTQVKASDPISGLDNNCMSEAALDSTTSCKSAGRELVSPSLQCDLVAFASRVGRTFKVSLPVPDFVGEPVGALKSFCGGLLSGEKHHPWSPAFLSLPLSERYGLAGSLFSFRKVLPGLPPSVSEYCERLSTPGDPPTDDYILFVRRTIRKIFRKGWDKGGWLAQTLGACPSSAASLVSSRGSGGARGELCGKRGAFLRAMHGAECPQVERERRVTTVFGDGKARIVSCSPASAVILSPLHKMIYNHLSKQGWLLRGEADPGKFSRFEVRDGEEFVSGDFESATDNLSIEVAEEILRGILDQCERVPIAVKTEALASLRAILVCEDRKYEQRRGQLMGNFLSFPLLCLQNYLSFKYLVPRKGVPVKINGDDIVFRATPLEAKRWFDGIEALGLKVSIGKTLVSNTVFSLNSTYFRGTRTRGARLIPVVRASFFYKPLEEPGSLTGRINAVGKGFAMPEASSLRVGLLRKYHSWVRTSQRSLTRGLGCRLTPAEVERAGFGSWERFYLSLPYETAPPAKVVVSGALPDGWARVKAPLGGSDDPGFRYAVARHAWCGRVKRLTSDDYFSVVRRDTVPYVHRGTDAWRRMARLLSGRSGQSTCARAVEPDVPVWKPSNRWTKAFIEGPLKLSVRRVKRVWCRVRR